MPCPYKPIRFKKRSSSGSSGRYRKPNLYVVRQKGSDRYAIVQNRNGKLLPYKTNLSKEDAISEKNRMNRTGLVKVK